MNQIRQALRRMVNVALQIDHVGPLMQHALLKTFLHRGRHFAHVTVPLAEIHVIADADDLGHERNHVRRLAHRFAVRDLRFFLVQIREAQAQRVRRRGEAETRARRVVAENGDRQPGVEDCEKTCRPVQFGKAVRRRARPRREVQSRTFPTSAGNPCHSC